MRKHLFVLLIIVHCLLFITNFYAQQPTQEWVANYPGPSSDGYGPFLQVDKAGNSYIAGTHVIGQYPNDSICILCVKYSTAGVQLWANLYRYPGQGYFEPTGFAIDTLGNAYVIAEYGPTYTDPLNGLIVKFNSISGNAVWARTFTGLTGASYFFEIKIDKQNNIYVGGVCDTAHLLIRYNVNGDTLWVRRYYPPSTSEVIYGCNFDDSLNIVFTGIRRHYYSFGSYDSVLAGKYTQGGALRWESTYANSYITHIGKKVVTDQNGNLYIGGSTAITGYPVFLTLKYDRNGVMQWAKIYDAPGNGDNTLQNIAFDGKKSNLYVTGINGMRKATTIKYNSATGDSIWVKNDTGIYSSSSSNDITVDTSGNIYITGSTYNYPPTIGAFMTVKYSSLGNRIWMITYAELGRGINIGKDNSNNLYVLGLTVSDYVVIKYNQLLGIRPISSEIPFAFNLKQNYPNPFNPSTRIRFSIPKRSFVELKIYDVLGRSKELALSQYVSASEYELTLDGTSYSSGIYFYQLIADGQIIDTKKMIVLK